MLKRQFVHPVIVPTRIEIEAHHHCVINRTDHNAVSGEDVHVIFDIVPDLQDRRIFEQPLQFGDGDIERHLLRRFGQKVCAAMREGNVAGPVGCRRKIHAHQPGLQGIERIRFGIDRDDAGQRRFFNPGVKRLHRLNADIGIEIKGQLLRFWH